MTEKNIKVEITSSYQDIAIASQGIVAMIKSQHPDPELTAAIELCLVEVCNNAVEHAYGDSNDHVIGLLLTMTNEEIRLLVIDSGKSMPESALAKEIDWAAEERRDVSGWQSSGHGLQLVKDLMDYVSYWTEDNKNHFQMVKKLPSTTNAK